MINTSSPKLYGLDHLRALAIILVFLSHCNNLIYDKPGWLPDTALFGWTGVDLFFCLSGFLISSQLFAEIKAGKTISFKTFFIKRFFRIIPAYLVMVAIYFLVPYFREKKGLAELWRFLTFTQNFGLDLSKTKAFTHSWSLCVEEHFYLVLPLILILFQKMQWLKKAAWLLLALFATGLIIRYCSFEHFYEPVSNEKGNWVTWYKYIYYPTYNRLDGLIFGVGIGAIFTFLPALRDRLCRLHYVFLATGLALLTCAWFVCEDQMTFEASVFGFPLISLGYACLVITALSPGNFLYRWNSSVTTFIATLSYAIYLSHKGVIHMTQEWFPGIDPNLMLIVCAILSIAFALVLHLLVEKPFMKLRAKILATTNKQVQL